MQRASLVARPLSSGVNIVLAPARLWLTVLEAGTPIDLTYHPETFPGTFPELFASGPKVSIAIGISQKNSPMRVGEGRMGPRGKGDERGPGRLCRVAVAQWQV